MKVKICGLLNEEAALHAARNGADALGFVFAESKREISLKTAKSIISKLPKEIKKVGVFVNPSMERIEEVVSETGIDYVQLHGKETPEFCRSIPYPIIKAFSIESAGDLKKVHDYPCEYILLDGPKGKYYGGNGVAFDWGILSNFDFKDKKVILAGGLNPQNVTAAIAETNASIVDVSSGVETNGHKDLEKIKLFLTRVKNS
ncbi:phosphoribosylanthranilate isomerase [Bacillus sp. V3B]|uniref:phosphoribosylanthranilate isomerase n=1 Tax=Bacillus sp. V3B TaxID=2804915 RepID=UPI0021096923|nr:phosphoribosylanthranilate isomerase [Bacillus sp. V3B]MCQ6274224.1 phosphoribosylanthranilate isomerase [Bacillus sp. V3B]